MDSCRIKEAIIVEGIYDKMKLEQFLDASLFPPMVLPCFGIANRYGNDSKLAKKIGIIILTDSDRAGFLIRRYIQSCIPAEHINMLIYRKFPARKREKAYRERKACWV
jgi:ribonuclease M5